MRKSPDASAGGAEGCAPLRPTQVAPSNLESAACNACLAPGVTCNCMERIPSSHQTLRNLRTLAIALAAFGATSTASLAQEVLPRDEALRLAFLVAQHEPSAKTAPIQVDSDLKRPFAAHEDDYGAMVLPETKLTAATFEAAGKDVIPVGQLWLRKLTPMVNGYGLDGSQVPLVNIWYEGESNRIPLCLLGARKTDVGGLELLVFGKGKEPVLRVPLARSTRTQSLPIELTG